MTPKFRAWDVKDRRWLSPLNLLMDMTGELYWGFAGTVKYQGNQKTANIIVEQWTGLKDKNGVEIFEGDIVEQEAITSYPGEYGGDIDLLYIGVVVMIPSKGACLKRPMVHDRLEDNQKWRCDYYKTIASYRSKVIGNIHATSELLNGEAKDA
uniref:Putative YopX protein n=1 Tax=viral metagenome TaxID=1070528 RepID=A0A6M3JQU8_9ZZZZ